MPEYCIGTPLFSNYLFFRIVHQVERSRGTGKGGVEPTEIIGCQVFIRHIPLVQKDILPLPALRLVASHGIGILHLQGVVVRVCLHLLHPLALHGDVGIIFEDGVEKPVVFCLGQRRRVGMQRIKQHVHFQFKVVIVGKDQRHVCKAEAIQLRVRRTRRTTAVSPLAMKSISFSFSVQK